MTSGGPLREERGMALGFAIIVVVIVGVMGAGLLTFVATDLEAVAEINRGEQAFELAEAGIEVAKAHLANDPNPADWSSGELTMTGMDQGTVTVTLEQTTRVDPSRPSPQENTGRRDARSKPPSPSKKGSQSS
jgi:Tfp pilus assembly protein PilX